MAFLKKRDEGVIAYVSMLLSSRALLCAWTQRGLGQRMSLFHVLNIPSPVRRALRLCQGLDAGLTFTAWTAKGEVEVEEPGGR